MLPVQENQPGRFGATQFGAGKSMRIDWITPSAIKGGDVVIHDTPYRAGLVLKVNSEAGTVTVPDLSQAPKTEASRRVLSSAAFQWVCAFTCLLALWTQCGLLHHLA
jgi:hypothetical protein